MPALSSTMTEGKIITWLKSEGDKITKGESVVVVESDKADMDVESCKHFVTKAGPLCSRSSRNTVTSNCT